jgi:peptidoglycan/xylan/chitin deacetylase (PgdA/CDA1 family)
LHKHPAKITFFCIGKNVINHSNIFKRIVNDGHSIGNLTQNYLNGWQHSSKEYLANFLEGDQKLTQLNKSKIT